MPINKKLKKFNTVGEYRNFLTTSDFSCSDVSSIGTSNIPSDLDVEYNPCQMLFVNTKYYLPPTATTITPIIDTITNGTIGCWYKQTTASTYTKLNSTDLLFYSAYTQNRITNLVFNTIGFSNLKDDANVEYVLSAKSSVDATITATDNCIQRGLITLSASTFPSAGGSQNVYIKTAPGNPWKITNTNGWLAFSSLTGVGPTTLVVTASTNSSESERIGNVTIEYTDVTYSTTGSITQEGVPEEFEWDDAEPGTASSLVINLNWDETSVSESYTNTFNGLTVNGSATWVTSKGLTSTSSNGTFTATTQQNTNTTSRNTTFSIVSNGNVVGTIQIIQAGKPALYFYVGNTADEATTTACTYASTVPTGSASYTVYYKNNYNTTEINSLTFNYDAMFSSASFVTKATAGTITFTVNENSAGNPQRTGYIRVMSGSTEVARITVTQAAGNNKYFYWGNTGSATTTTLTATYTQTSVTATYRTNYTTLTTGSSTSVITAATLTSGTFTGKFSANSTYVQRTDTVTIYGDGVAVATLTFTQDAAPTPTYSISVYYAGGGYQWSAGTTSNLSNTVKITTVNQGWSGYDAPSWISVSDSSGAGSGDHYVTITCDQAVEDERSYSVRFYGSVEGSDYVDVYQPGTGSTPVTYSITTTGSISNFSSAGGTDTSCSITTQNQGWGISSKPSWVTVSPSSQSSEGTYNLTITINENTSTGSRSDNITFTGTTQGSDTISVSQNGTTPPPVTYGFEWDDFTTTAASITGLSSDGETGRTGYEVTGYTDVRISTTPYSWLTLNFSGGYLYYTADTKTTTGTRDDTNTVQAKKQDNTWVDVGSIYIEQNGATPITYNFEWDNNSDSKSISLDWDDTSISEDYINNYSLRSTVYSSSTASWISNKNLSSTSSNGTLTATVSQNTGSSDRSVDLYVRTGSTPSSTVGTLTVTQSGKPQEKTLTAITISLGTAPTIPCTGGNISTGDVSYTVTAYYSDGTDETVDANVTASPSTGKSASSLAANQTDDPTYIGDITYSASYTYNGVTERNSNSVSIYQDENPIVHSQQIGTGTTDTETHSGTKTGGTVTYSISCSPTSDTVSSSAGSVSVDVTATKNVPTTAYTYDTYYKTTSYTDTLCSGAEVPRTETASTKTSGATAQTSTYVDNQETGFTVSRNATGWNSYTQSSTGVSISYDAYNTTSTTSRTVTYTFKVTGKSSPSCTYVLTQESQPEPTRNITIEPSGTMKIEHNGSAVVTGDWCNFEVAAVGGSGRISYECQNIEASTQNTYSSTGSISVDVTTGATTIELYLTSLNMEKDYHFYGVSGDWTDIDCYLSGGGTTISSGSDTITLSLSAGSSDVTIYLSATGNPSMVAEL